MATYRVRHNKPEDHANTKFRREFDHLPKTRDPIYGTYMILNSTASLPSSIRLQSTQLFPRSASARRRSSTSFNFKTLGSGGWTQRRQALKFEHIALHGRVPGNATQLTLPRVGPDIVHLNELVPADPYFAPMWPELAMMQGNGTKIIGMLGGAAPGTYDCLVDRALSASHWETCCGPDSGVPRRLVYNYCERTTLGRRSSIERTGYRWRNM
ncbi:hypothetical protein C8Q80DRAFT_1123287 [Daedaleopsis nitida]|nr:hypothetical protein C8Q80DRAFT_1123287 [Daedaleopsis nitida]